MNEYNCYLSCDTLFACIFLYNLNNIVVYKKNHLNFLKFKLKMSNSNAKKRPYDRTNIKEQQKIVELMSRPENCHANGHPNFNKLAKPSE